MVYSEKLDMNEIKKKPVGRPRKPIPYELDVSMTVEQAREQKTIAEAKDKIYSAKIKELKLEEAAKNVIPVKDCVDIVTGVFTKLKTILYSASNNIPAQILGKEHGEVTQVIYRFVDESLARCISDFEQRLDTIHINDDSEGEEEFEEVND